MTFLAPAAGLIGAAVAVPVLLVYYFLKLRRRPLRVTSTLLWERAVLDLQVNSPLRWLRASWLLVLQLLILGSLLAALARPALSGEGPMAGRVVLLIDRSASMSARDGEPAKGASGPATRLDEAKRRAEELIGRVLASGGSAALVGTFGARARALTGFTSDRASLLEAVRSIEPSDQPGDLVSAMRLVESLGTGERDETRGAPPERTIVYVLSDGSFGGGIAGAAAAELPRVRGAELRYVRVGGHAAADETSNRNVAGRDNLGIVAISARRDYEDPAVARVFVRVLNAAGAPVSAMLELRVDGKLVEARPITVPGREPPAGGPTPPRPSATAGPATAPNLFPTAMPGAGTSADYGEGAATFSLDQREGGLVVVSITRPDLLAADDAAGIVLHSASRPSVLLVAPAPPAPPDGAPAAGEGGEAATDPFLHSALEAMDLSRLRVVDGPGYERLVRGGGGGEAGGGAPERLEGYDLIVFDRVRPSVLPAQTPSISFGAAPPVPGLTVGPIDPSKDAGFTHFVSWQRTHPVLRYVGLDPIIVGPPMKLTLPGADSSAVRAEALAYGVDGPLIALIEEAGRSPGSGVRRLIVAFDLAQTNWRPDVSFPVFLANAIDFLTLRGEAAAGRSYTTTEPVTVRVKPELGREGGTGSPRRLVARGPITIQASVPQGASEVSLGMLERAGVYQVEGAQDAERVVAVNLADALESRVEVAERLPVAGTDGGVPATQDLGPREVWPWFVGAALGLLTVEWFLYAWRMRG